LRRLLGDARRGWAAALFASALAPFRLARKQDAAVRAPPDPASRRVAVQKSEDESIAEELGLRADLAVDELRRIRRDFAKRNHPDCFETSGSARRGA
jgi:hypothetical protein